MSRSVKRNVEKSVQALDSWIPILVLNKASIKQGNQRLQSLGLFHGLKKAKIPDYAQKTPRSNE